MVYISTISQVNYHPGKLNQVADPLSGLHLTNPQKGGVMNQEEDNNALTDLSLVTLKSLLETLPQGV